MNYVPTTLTDRDALARIMRRLHPADQDRLQALLNDAYRAEIALRAFGKENFVEDALNELSTQLWWDAWTPEAQAKPARPVDLVALAEGILLGRKGE